MDMQSQECEVIRLLKEAGPVFGKPLHVTGYWSVYFLFRRGSRTTNPMSSYHPSVEECLGQAWHSQVALKEIGPHSLESLEKPREDTWSGSLLLGR